jgi:hypothetical protein
MCVYREKERELGSGRRRIRQVCANLREKNSFVDLCWRRHGKRWDKFLLCWEVQTTDFKEQIKKKLAVAFPWEKSQDFFLSHV